MKIVILNGSPKGDESVTMQYMQYIKKKILENEYKFLNVAQQVSKIEKDDTRFQEIMKEIQSADGIIWGFPVYVMLICSQFKRFIELLFERNAQSYFRDKYTATLSTSIHFYDHSAQNYMQAICDDLNMKFIDYFSADSWDLLYPQKRQIWLQFMKNFFMCIEKKRATQKKYSPLLFRDFSYEPKLNLKEEQLLKLDEKKMLIITDSTNSDNNLGKMINQLRSFFADEIETINIHDLNLISGCIGCTQCGYNHSCIFEDKDEFKRFWEEKLMKADILIFAGQMKDRFLSARWKMIYDRAFYNNHTPTLINKQVGYLISGPLSQNQNLREILQAYVEYQNSNLVGIVTDEFGTSEELDHILFDFVQSMLQLSKQELIKPPTFLGVGGMKIFRDDVYGRNRFAFLADHVYYETHGIYDTFPQRDDRAKRINKKLIPLMRNDKVRKKLNLKQEFLKPFKRVIEDPNK
ncbi:MAG: NAD(P)H-dependent oxidoreductase [Promethearchaeota archaeon]